MPFVTTWALHMTDEPGETGVTLILVVLLALATALSCGTIWLGLVALARVQS